MNYSLIELFTQKLECIFSGVTYEGIQEACAMYQMLVIHQAFLRIQSVLEKDNKKALKLAIGQF